MIKHVYELLNQIRLCENRLPNGNICFTGDFCNDCKNKLVDLLDLAADETNSKQLELPFGAKQ